MWLFLAFLAVPLIEIALFIQVGGAIGLFPTLAIVIVTAILGTWLVRAQGLMALNDVQRSFSSLNDPSVPLAHGAMILFAGALLLTPGFFTDATGFALLVPAVRTAIMNYAKSRIKVQGFSTTSHQSAGFENTASDDTVIDGDFVEVDDPKKPTHPASGWTKH